MNNRFFQPSPDSDQLRQDYEDFKSLIKMALFGSLAVWVLIIIACKTQRRRHDNDQNVLEHTGSRP